MSQIDFKERTIKQTILFIVIFIFTSIIFKMFMPIWLTLLIALILSIIGLYFFEEIGYKRYLKSFREEIIKKAYEANKDRDPYKNMSYDNFKKYYIRKYFKDE